MRGHWRRRSPFVPRDAPWQGPIQGPSERGPDHGERPRKTGRPIRDGIRAEHHGRCLPVQRLLLHGLLERLLQALLHELQLHGAVVLVLYLQPELLLTGAIAVADASQRPPRRGPRRARDGGGRQIDLTEFEEHTWQL